ncbi:MAG: hypothetical protein AAF750_14035 [Planctomycetota bacterium]
MVKNAEGASSAIRLWAENAERRIVLAQVGGPFIQAAEFAGTFGPGPIDVIVDINGQTHRHGYLLETELSADRLSGQITPIGAGDPPF